MSVHDSHPAYGAPHSVVDVIDCLHRLSEEKGCISVGDIIDALGTRTYGPMLIVPALLEITPLGAVPGVPTFLAVTIAIFAVQMLFGRHRFWVPGIIENRRFGASKLHAATHKLMPIAERLDRWFHGRLRFLTQGVGTRMAAATVLLLCFAVPPLEFLPFASSGPMLAIALIGLALLVRDGALMLVALAIGIAAVSWGATSLLGVGGGG